jgi:hypothetical protein
VIGATTRLQMRACRAARAFARRRMVRRSRRQRLSWRPIALRWRRAMALAARSSGALKTRMQRSGRSTWQVHMHLRVAAGVAPQRDPRTTARPAVEPTRALSVVPKVWPQPPRNDSRASADNATASKPRSGAGAAMIRPIMRVVPTMTSQRATPAKRLPPMATMQLRPRPSAAQVPQSPESRAPVTGGSVAQPPTLRLHRSHQPQTAHRVAPHPPSAIDAFMTRSPELVWRTREPTPADTFEPLHAQANNQPPARPTPEQTVEVKLPPEARIALRSQHLDPAFVDRVADDVIRRIDRRLRIERERRGL